MGAELLFLNFNAVMGVTADGRVSRAPQLGRLLQQCRDLHVVLVTDAQRSPDTYARLLGQMPESIASRICAVATTAPVASRFADACVRFADAFEASNYIALDSASRGYGDRCPFLVVTGASGLDESTVDRCIAQLRRQAQHHEIVHRESLGARARAAADMLLSNERLRAVTGQIARVTNA